MPRWRGVGEIRPAAGRRRPVAPRCGVRALALTLAWGAALAPAGAVTCTVPSASYASLARAVNDAGCTTIDLGTGIFTGAVDAARTLTLVGDGTVQTILAGPVVARGAGTVVTLRQLRVDGTQPTSSGCPGPALRTEGGGQVLAPQPTVVTDTAAVVGPCTLFADGFESGNVKAWALP